MRQALTMVICLAMTLLSWPKLQAQTPEAEPCGTMHMLEKMEADNPAIKQHMDAMERHTAEFIQSYRAGTNRMDDQAIVIPVVFHVIYETPNQNISEAQILDQLRILNEDFRRLNADTTNTPAVFDSIAADIRVEFCLASVDPDGNNSTGITRTQTTVPTWGFTENMKFDSTGGHDAWDRDRYLNFWVVNFSGGLLGFAQFPIASGIGTGAPETDGVVVDYQFTGSIEEAATTNYAGRVGTHEVGHWLNLRHVWGDGDCSVDDFVDDTPLSSFPSGTLLPCTFPGVNTCNTGPDDLPNMFQNYMDYGDGLCQNLFTEGQKMRMLATLAPGGDRHSLLTSSGCCPTTTCPRPEAQSIISMDDSSAMITWSDPATVVSSDIRYRPVGDTAWVTGFPATGGSYLLSGLNLCTEYEVQVRSFCSSDSSSFCLTLKVETDGCCRAPTTLLSSEIDASMATISWGEVYGAFQYDLQYRPLGDTTWSSLTTTDSLLEVQGLEPCQGYEYRVKPKCDTLGNIFSETGTFFTEGCEACTEAAYCTPGGTTNLNWVDSVSIGPIQTLTGNNAGYLDFGITSEEMVIDSTYEIFLRRGGPATFPRKWGVWLDLNRDGDFDDAGEAIFISSATQDVEVTSSFTLGPQVDLGRTRMRIGNALAFDPNLTLLPCDTSNAGEYEDYCLNLVAPCTVPSNFFAVLDSGDSSIFVSWQSAPYNDTFLLEYRPSVDSTWQSVGIGDQSFFILSNTELTSCTEYFFRLRSACGDSSSAATLADTVVTLCRVGLDPRLAQAVKLYPNPSKGAWTVEAPVALTGVRLYDMYGREVLHRTAEGSRLTIETPNLAPGLYLVQIATTQGDITKRLIISE